MSRSCSICQHPRRAEAEDLLRQGRSVRHCASEIGVGAAALHRHWKRHAGNRDTMLPVDQVVRGNEISGSETLAAAELRQPAAVPGTGQTAQRPIVRHPAGGQPCWYAVGYGGPLELRAALASTLMAGLELARGGAVRLRQKRTFGPILARRAPSGVEKGA